MKLNELSESMGAARGLANISLTKKEIADATYNMHVDGTVSKKYKPEDITDKQATAFIDQMHAVDTKFPDVDSDGQPNDSDEQIRAYEEARDALIAKILGKDKE